MVWRAVWMRHHGWREETRVEKFSSSGSDNKRFAAVAAAAK